MSLLVFWVVTTGSSEKFLTSLHLQVSTAFPITLIYDEIIVNVSFLPVLQIYNNIEHNVSDLFRNNYAFYLNVSFHAYITRYSLVVLNRAFFREFEVNRRS
jgi:hypothetical protein